MGLQPPEFIILAQRLQFFLQRSASAFVKTRRVKLRQRRPRQVAKRDATCGQMLGFRRRRQINRNSGVGADFNK